jgi:hypothetical protein
MLKNNFTNCLDFEHTVFITEYFTDYILSKCGFKILEKEYYGNPHSIFYATEKVVESQIVELENKYNEYKEVFQNFVKYHQDLVKELNEKIEQEKRPVHLFGAHIFSQYLLNFGLRTDKITSILDNSSLKQGKRLYGTNFLVESAKILREKQGAVVILKAGIYNNEIKKDILENINANVIFW